MRNGIRWTLAVSCLGVLLAAPRRSPAQDAAGASASAPPATQPSGNPPDYFAPGYQAQFSFDNAPLSDALKALSDSFGFVVVPMVPVTGNITVISRYPVSSDDALTLLDIALKSNGYFSQREGHTIKIYALPTENPPSTPPVTVTEPDAAPPASQPADGSQ